MSDRLIREYLRDWQADITPGQAAEIARRRKILGSSDDAYALNRDEADRGAGNPLALFSWSLCLAFLALALVWPWCLLVAGVACAWGCGIGFIAEASARSRWEERHGIE